MIKFDVITLLLKRSKRNFSEHAIMKFSYAIAAYFIGLQFYIYNHLCEEERAILYPDK